MGQKERVLKYIGTYGSISPLEAFRDLGITKLATVISNLRYQDHTIIYQTLCYSHNRFGEKVHFMRYWLDKHLFEEYMKNYNMFYEEMKWWKN